MSQAAKPFFGAGECDLHEVCRRGEHQCPYHQAIANGWEDVTPGPPLPRCEKREWWGYGSYGAGAMVGCGRALPCPIHDRPTTESGPTGKGR